MKKSKHEAGGYGMGKRGGRRGGVHKGAIHAKGPAQKKPVPPVEHRPSHGYANLPVDQKIVEAQGLLQQADELLSQVKPEDEYGAAFDQAVKG